MKLQNYIQDKYIRIGIYIILILAILLLSLHVYDYFLIVKLNHMKYLQLENVLNNLLPNALQEIGY